MGIYAMQKTVEEDEHEDRVKLNRQGLETRSLQCCRNIEFSQEKGQGEGKRAGWAVAGFKSRQAGRSPGFEYWARYEWETSRYDSVASTIIALVKKPT